MLCGLPEDPTDQQLQHAISQNPLHVRELAVGLARLGMALQANRQRSACCERLKEARWVMAGAVEAVPQYQPELEFIDNLLKKWCMLRLVTS